MIFPFFNPALIQAVFDVGDLFWKKNVFFFQGKFYFLKAHEHYFIVFIYLANWRAAKLGIFTHLCS